MRALILIGMHQYNRAEEYERTAAEIAPHLADFPANLARIYWLQHKIPQAVAAERSAARLEALPRAAAFMEGLGPVEEAFSNSGYRAAAFLLIQLRERTGYSGGTWDLGLQYALVEDRERVLAWVASEIGKNGYGGIYHFKSAPELDFIRSDPRFQDLLRRIGLPL